MDPTTTDRNISSGDLPMDRTAIVYNTSSGDLPMHPARKYEAIQWQISTFKIKMRFPFPSGMILERSQREISR
jgi:hypothetical protein